jgi:hypothetical protein
LTASSAHAIASARQRVAPSTSANAGIAHAANSSQLAATATFVGDQIVDHEGDRDEAGHDGEREDELEKYMAGTDGIHPDTTPGA